ncbi:unnamed protein product [Mesocestoides corti]|nr:unnamed protein product [Mesocestoides corti]
MAERSSAAALQQLESKNLELQSLQERLLKVANEHEEFQDKQLQLVTSLETEKRIFMERVRRAEKKVERFEKETQAKSPINPRSPSPVSNGRGTSRTSASGGANRSSHDSQLNFLNSIIVDLHAKNAELEQQLRSALENHSRGDANEKTKPLQKAKEKHTSSSKLRFWCDNCEVFDLHDTEQCPNEPQFSRSNVVHRLARNVVPSTDRKYCDNCGIFDLHNTEECTEDPQETF